MDNFDKSIQKAKKETTPKDSFVDGVMARIADEPVLKHRTRFLSFWAPRLAGGLAALAILATAGFSYLRPQNSSQALITNIDGQTSQIEQDLSQEANSPELDNAQLNTSAFTN